MNFIYLLEIFFIQNPKKFLLLIEKHPSFIWKMDKKKVFLTLVFRRYGGHWDTTGVRRRPSEPPPADTFFLLPLSLSLSLSPPLSSFPYFFSWVLVTSTKFPKFSKARLYIFSFFIILLLFKLCPFLLKLLLLIFKILTTF